MGHHFESKIRFTPTATRAGAAPKALAAGAFAFLLVAVPALAQYPEYRAGVPEPPSPVGAHYVRPSPHVPLRPGEKIGGLATLNQTRAYVLQRLTARTWWVQTQFFSTVFYVGRDGVLLFDPVEGGGEELVRAIRDVTHLPVTAVVYSHGHADYIGDAEVVLGHYGRGRYGYGDDDYGYDLPDRRRGPAVKRPGRVPRAGVRLIASGATADKLRYLESRIPRPTEIVAWPRGSFMFENLTVRLHGFTRGAHSDDHAAWLLVEERVAHVPELVTPDQPPSWQFAGAESFVYYEDNVRDLNALDWAYLNGGQGNVGSREDVRFHLAFVRDLKAAVGRAMEQVRIGHGIEPGRVDSHDARLAAWLNEVSRRATVALRPKYGRFRGFEISTPRNAETVAMSLLRNR